MAATLLKVGHREWLAVELIEQGCQVIRLGEQAHALQCGLLASDRPEVVDEAGATAQQVPLLGATDAVVRRDAQLELADDGDPGRNGIELADDCRVLQGAALATRLDDGAEGDDVRDRAALVQLRAGGCDPGR